MKSKTNSRRNFIKNALFYSGVIGASLIGTTFWTAYQYDNELKEIYGTKENPTFTIVNNPEDTHIITYSNYANRRLSKKIDKLTDILNKIDSEMLDQINHYEKKISEFEEYFESFDKTQNNIDRITNYLDLASSITEYKIILSEYNNIINRAIEEGTSKSPEEQVYKFLESENRENYQKIYGDPVSRGELLFELMTGKKVPTSHESKIVDKLEKEDSMGEHWRIFQEIRVKEDFYECMLLTTTHELGHVASQQEESIPLWSSRKNDVDQRMLLEEASAYAFQLASIDFEKEVELKIFLRIIGICTIKIQTENYFQGSKRLHDHAVTLADATTTYFNCPRKAFNYLSTTNEIDPEIFKIIESNRLIYQSYTDLNNNIIKKIKDIDLRIMDIDNKTSRIDNLLFE